MKKSQFQIIPLLYVFALIVGALILVFGIRQILILMDAGEEVELGTFKTEFEKQTRFIYNLDAGSSDEISIPIPSKVRLICFTDGSGNIQTSNQQLKDLIYLNPTHNLFIITADESEDSSFKISNLKSDQSPLCVEPGGKKLNLILENKGNYVSPTQ